MNFLAHFLITSASDSPEFAVGALLPDIAKRAGIALKASQIQLIKPEYEAFRSGIELHWRTDRVFHNSDLFDLGVSWWKAALPTGNFPATSKTFFLYHLLLEMWIDRVLMTYQPGADAEMYQKLNEVDSHLMEKFVLENLDDEELKVRKTFVGFCQRQFISHYHSPNRFAGIAVDVFGHVTRQLTPPTMLSNIQEALEKLSGKEPQLLEHWKNLRAEIRAD